jgi:hypothetical protein
MDKTQHETKATKSESSGVTYKYVGNGDNLQGVPARDLTKDDLDALPDGVTKKDLEASGLYKKGAR